MLRTIDLGRLEADKMNEKTEKIFRTFLRRQFDKPIKKQTDTHHLMMRDDELQEDVIYKFQLSDDILTRGRKSGKPGERHEVLRSEIGEGGQGKILRSIGVLYFSSNKLFFKPKSHAVKKQPHGFFSTREYEHSKLAAQLRVIKPVTIREEDGIYDYMVMRDIPGKNLYQLMMDEEDGIIKFDTDARIKISLLILHAIKEQSHNIGIIHRDIKSENLMLNRATDEMNLIDYALSVFLNTPNEDPGISGTAIMQPAEQFKSPPKDFTKFTLASDYYAAGKTLAEFWNAISESYKLTEGSLTLVQIYNECSHLAEADTKYDYTNFETGNLTPEHADRIKNLFEQMTRARPEQRWSLDTAIEIFEQIQSERLAAKMEFRF